MGSGPGPAWTRQPPPVGVQQPQKRRSRFDTGPPGMPPLSSVRDPGISSIPPPRIGGPPPLPQQQGPPYMPPGPPPPWMGGPPPGPGSFFPPSGPASGPHAAQPLFRPPPADLRPTLQYYDLPAALIVPLIKLPDCDYKPLNPADLRLPPPQPPSQRLLAALEQFYAPPMHDSPRDR